MLGSGFRLYLAYTNTTTPLVVSSLVKQDGTAATAGGQTVNDIIHTTGVDFAKLKLADEIKDVTETGNPNTVDTTTRRVARQGVSSSEISTISRDLSVQLAYEPHSAFNTPATGYEVLDLLEYCEESKSAIFIIDLDKATGVAGGKGSGANYTVALSQPREVQGQVVYDATFALKSFAQRIEWDGVAELFKAKFDP